MLHQVGASSLDDLAARIVPTAIRDLNLPAAIDETVTEAVPGTAKLLGALPSRAASARAKQGIRSGA